MLTSGRMLTSWLCGGMGRPRVHGSYGAGEASDPGSGGYLNGRGSLAGLTVATRRWGLLQQSLRDQLDDVSVDGVAERLEGPRARRRQVLKLAKALQLG